jgi:hypothetical protein
MMRSTPSADRADGRTIIDSAANLKFLSDSLQIRYRNFKFKAALKAIIG